MKPYALSTPVGWATNCPSFCSWLFKVQIFLVVFLVSCSRSTTHPVNALDTINLPFYKSQEKIILQIYTSVPSPFGYLSSVVFGYDRNKDNSAHFKTQSGRLGVDLLEVKLLNNRGYWYWFPYLVYIDDNFDGFADRLFLDSNLDGLIDQEHALPPYQFQIEKIQFDSIEAWNSNHSENQPTI